MRIGCLQFAPQVGDVDNNLNRADAVLSKANPKNLDLLVLPELAFSGYNFRSLQHISPYLEPTAAGITSLWARTTALKYDCVVTVGYPEKVDVAPKWPASPEYYNSAITVNADGETIANYRKSFLYYTDETWALEGPDGFFDGAIPGLGNVAMGICKWPTKSFERMDLNPYKFEAPWSAWEFSYHCLHKQANLVIISMAWLTREDPRAYSRSPKEPDMETLSYWLGRMEPLIRAETEGEIICVFANRTGSEEEAVYAGTSAVLGIHGGEVKVYGILGRGEKELLVVDTNKRPQAKLISEPNSIASDTPPPDLVPSGGVPEVESRTNSTTSNRSALSVDTKNTTRTTPDILDDLLSPRTLNEALTPLSGVDIPSPEDFYTTKGRKIEGEYLREDLISSLSQKSTTNVHQFPPIDPTSPKYKRSASPRSAIDQSQHFSPTEPTSPPFNRPFSRGASPVEPASPPFYRPSSRVSQKPSYTASAEPSPPLIRSSSRASAKPVHVSSAEPSPPLNRTSSRASTKSAQVSSAEPSPPLIRSSSRASTKSVHVSSAEPSPPLDRPTSRVSQQSIQFGTAEPSPPIKRSNSRTSLKSCLVRHQSSSSVEVTSPIFNRPTSTMSQGSILSQRSNLTQQQFSPAVPDSPTFNRPASPKSRNASRTRHLEHQLPGLTSQGLTREEQVAQRSAGLKSSQVPQTALNIPPEFQSQFANNFFGPRTSHVLPRPRSTYW